MQHMDLVFLGGAIGGLMGLLAAGCADITPIDNPNHCANRRGDTSCEEWFPDGSVPFCVVDTCELALRGCVAERPSDECYSKCGDKRVLAEDPTCEDDTAAGSSSSGSDDTPETTDAMTGTGTTTGDTGVPTCESNDDCTDEAAPFCGDAGTCVACTEVASGDEACAGKFPDTPVCGEGICVQCDADQSSACTGTTPVCDTEANACIGCTAHDQCSASACNFAEGNCLDEANVWHVDGDGEQDYETITEALGQVPAGGEGTIIVHAAATYEEALDITDRTVAIFGADGEAPPSWRSTSGDPTLTVSTGATVFLEGLRMSENPSAEGLRVDAGTTWVDRSAIVNNNDGGIVLQNAATLTLRNSFVTGGNDTPIALSSQSGTAEIFYSTLVSSGFDTPRALSCAPTDSVTVRNSILVTEGGSVGEEVNCAGAQLSNSATEETVGAFPDGDAESWFVGLGQGNLRLQNEGLTVFEDIATWELGDPPVDIDGDPRPTTDGTPDYAGADVP